MTIGIDARMLGPLQGGIGRYIEQLVKHFGIDAPQYGNTMKFVVFLRKENWDLVQETSNLKKILADIPWYGWREQLFLPKILKRERIDLMHFPHWNIPFLYNRSFVVTIHDLLLIHYPTRSASTLGPISYFFKNLAYRIILKHAIKKSQRIFAPSEFTKQDIIKTFAIAPNKIVVTPLAPSADSDFPATDVKEDVMKKYSISKPYILYVGVAYPHKNLDGLIRAWKIFCDQHGDGYQLVLAGRKNFFYQQLATKARDVHSIIFTDFVPEKDLPAFYHNASLYIFPSFYEGFGLPPLEAMRHGVPVVSSNATCLPEILKDAALYFDPHNSDEMSATIWRGLTDQNLRAELTQKSVQLIHNLSWERTANTTLEQYKNLL